MQIAESKRGLTIKLTSKDLEKLAKARQHNKKALIQLRIETCSNALPRFYHLRLVFQGVIPSEEVKYPMQARVQNGAGWEMWEGKAVVPEQIVIGGE